MPHVALLGDSVFDNGVYVGGGPDVGAQLRQTLPADWEVSLLAVDGSVTREVAAQLGRLPAECSHIVLSSGGNDALNRMPILEERVSNVSEALLRLTQATETFRADYRELLTGIRATGLPAAVCTVYVPNWNGPLERQVGMGAVGLFDDVIATEARRAGVDVVELRDIFTSPDDYANPIEPSVVGGAKLAEVIATLLLSDASTS